MLCHCRYALLVLKQYFGKNAILREWRFRRDHDELGAGFGGSHSSESHENAAHFVPPPVAADDLSRSLKDDVPIKEEAPGTSASASDASNEGKKTRLDNAIINVFN